MYIAVTALHSVMSLIESFFNLFLVAIFVLCLFKYHWSRRHLYIFSAKLPGPLAFPIIGNGLKFFCKKEDVLKVIVESTEPYASPLRLWLGPRLLVIVKDPDQLQTILQSTKISTKSYFYTFLEPFLGKGLFTSSGTTHKNHRKMLQPLFAQRMLEGYSHLFQKHANKLVDNIKSQLDGSQFNILLHLHDSAFEATMDILLEDENNHSIDYKDIPKYVRRFYDLFFTRVSTFWLHPDVIYKRTKFFREQEEMSKLAKTMTQELMNTKVPEIMKRLEDNSKIEFQKEVRTPSLLEMIMEMLMEDPNLLTEQECIDHMMTFVATSQDTQSSAIAFTLMMLGMHLEIQETVIKELKEIVGERMYVDFTDASNLKFLEMCIKESMRLFPLAPFVFRDTVDDFLLDKWTIPKNTTVVIGIYNVHRDPAYWEKPNEFYPEHFTPESTAKRHPYAYLPFSAGPRKCIAQHYSYINMKIVIATILLNYFVESEQKLKDLKIMTDVSVRPIDGYLIKIRKRNI